MVKYKKIIMKEVKNMKEYDEIKSEIENMKLSKSFRKSIEQFISAVEKNDKFRIWELQDTIYTSVKLENIDKEDMRLIKEFIFLKD